MYVNLKQVSQSYLDATRKLFLKLRGHITVVQQVVVHYTSFKDVDFRTDCCLLG